MTNIRTLSSINQIKSIPDIFTGVGVPVVPRVQKNSLNTMLKKSQFDNLLANYTDQKSKKVPLRAPRQALFKKAKIRSTSFTDALEDIEKESSDTKDQIESRVIDVVFSLLNQNFVAAATKALQLAGMMRDAGIKPAAAFAILRPLFQGPDGLPQELRNKQTEIPNILTDNQEISDPKDLYQAVRALNKIAPLSFEKYSSKRPKMDAMSTFINRQANKITDLMKTANLTENYLSSFPQWAVSNQKKMMQNFNKIGLNTAAVSQLSDPDNKYFMNMSRLGLDSDAYYDTQAKVWKGRLVQKHVKKTQNSLTSLTKKLRGGSNLMTISLTPQQAQNQIPSFVKQVVKANSNLSQVGFGPISAKSSNFYAGRWLDTSTGNVRILPTANSKYINPISKQQKLGYLQAKILNHWNLAVSSYDQYQKLRDSNTADFKDKAAQMIENQLDMDGLVIRFANYINNTIDGYIVQQSKNATKTAKMILLGAMEPSASEVRSILPSRIESDSATNRQSKDLEINAKFKISQWIKGLNQALKTSVQGVQELNQPQPIKDQLIYKLRVAHHSLVGFAGRSLKNVARIMLRTSLPIKMSYDYVNNQMKQDIQNSQSALQAVQYATPDILSENSINAIKTYGAGFANQLRQYNGQQDSRGGLGKYLTSFTDVLKDSIKQGEVGLVDKYQKPVTAKRSYDDAFSDVIDKMRLNTQKRVQQLRKQRQQEDAKNQQTRKKSQQYRKQQAELQKLKQDAGSPQEKLAVQQKIQTVAAAQAALQAPLSKSQKKKNKKNKKKNQAMEQQ